MTSHSEVQMVSARRDAGEMGWMGVLRRRERSMVRRWRKVEEKDMLRGRVDEIG